MKPKLFVIYKIKLYSMLYRNTTNKTNNDEETTSKKKNHKRTAGKRKELKRYSNGSKNTIIKNIARIQRHVSFLKGIGKRLILGEERQ